MDAEYMNAEITQHSHPRRRRRLGALLLLSLVSGSIGAGALSLAVFTDTKASSANIFTDGTIILGVTPAPAAITSTNMMPGDIAKGSIVVANNGTSTLRYAMTSAWTNTDTKSLMTQLTLTVKTLGTSCAAWDGTSLYTGAANVAKFGDPAQGGQTGDRTLNFGTNETLCFQVTLPLGTGNTYQAATTTGTFTFAAEQTANNT